LHCWFARVGDVERLLHKDGAATRIGDEDIMRFVHRTLPTPRIPASVAGRFMDLVAHERRHFLEAREGLVDVCNDPREAEAHQNCDRTLKGEIAHDGTLLSF